MSRIVTIGDTFSKSVSLPAETIKAFATVVGDLNPLHHDEAYARQSRFGSLIASGIHPTSLLMGLVATHFSAFGQPLGLEFSFKLLEAIRAGDTVTATWTVVDAFWKASLNGDLTTLDGVVVNQRGNEVLTAKAKILVMPKSIDGDGRGAKKEAAS